MTTQIDKWFLEQMITEVSTIAGRLIVYARDDYKHGRIDDEVMEIVDNAYHDMRNSLKQLGKVAAIEELAYHQDVSAKVIAESKEDE